MPYKIMIADDSASMRQLVSFTLRDAGYEVLEAVDGQDAHAKAQATRLDMVVTDLNMPGLDGIQLIRALRGMPAHRFTPIVMLTTESQDTKKQEGKQAGASGWIVKPFSPESLVKVIKKFLR